MGSSLIYGSQWLTKDGVHASISKIPLVSTTIKQHFSFSFYINLSLIFGIAALPDKTKSYIQVFLDGGLNQQRMGICDAVAVAKILNATLVIPFLEINPVWQDSSSFVDIFDVDHFIDALKDDVRVVKELPEDYSWSTREYYAAAVRETRVKTAPVHASAQWYIENVSPLLHRYI